MAKTTYSKEITENIFMGITPPEYKMIKFRLAQCVTTGIQKKVEISKNYDYILDIGVDNIDSSQIDEMSNNLKDLFGLQWNPYDWKTKNYHYFTTRYQEESVKKSRLEQILQYLTDFEIQYLPKVEKALEIFNEDAVSKASYKDYDIAVKYHEGLKSFVVIALNFLGSERYAILRKSSLVNGKLSTSEIDKSFFANLVKIEQKDPIYFLVNPASYEKIKDLIKTKKEEITIFKNEQKLIASQYKNEYFPNITTPNIFDLKIEFDKESSCFLFYCKNYKQNDYAGHITPRGVVGNWAINFILSELSTKEQIVEYKSKYGSKFDDEDICREGYYKIPLDFLPNSNKKEKSLILPATDIEKLKTIEKNYLEYEYLWSKIPKIIKITDNAFLSNVPPMGINDLVEINLKSFPSIFLDNKGKSFFIYNFRNISLKKVENPNTSAFIDDDIDMFAPNTVEKEIRKASINMTGLELTFKEMIYFLNEHPISAQIKANSVYLNTEIWMKGKDANFGTNMEDREKMFEKIYLHSKLLNEAKVSKITTKKVKI